MPWVKELEQENTKRILEAKAARVKSVRPATKKLSMKKEPDLASFKLDKIDELRYLSKVIQHLNVEEFDWKFDDKNLLRAE